MNLEQTAQRVAANRSARFQLPLSFTKALASTRPTTVRAQLRVPRPTVAHQAALAVRPIPTLLRVHRQTRLLVPATLEAVVTHTRTVEPVTRTAPVATLTKESNANACRNTTG